jgi:aspartyl-tRNA(Asn)/glutamyl-tRNA(Gln) amidotransferase subunit A
MYDTIADAAEALRSGATSASALVEASLHAIASGNARINAFVAVHADAARQAALLTDEERRRGVDRGPLHGIPVSLKDLIDVAGEVTTAGSHVLADRAAKRDALVVTRLRDAGAITIGRTNLHEFALGTTSEDSAFGPVHHPDDVSRSPGGSSGGSAAAVATGMGLASIGTDTGGSVRIPSAICGIVGLKPTFGEIPTDGVIPLSTSLDHVGPLARSVQDAAWLHQVMAGRPTATLAARNPRDLTLASLGGYFSSPLEPVVEAAFRAAKEQLTAAGATITTADLPDAHGIMAAYVNTVLSEAAAWHGRWLDERRDQYTPVVGARLAHGRTIAAVDYLEARAFCDRLRTSVDRILGSADAIILPTVPIVAPLLGATDITIAPEVSREQTSVRAATLRQTQPFNMTGHPAISLPIESRGFPVGLQIVGRRNATDQLLAIAAACESVLGRPARNSRQ